MVFICPVDIADIFSVGLTSHKGVDKGAGSLVAMGTLEAKGYNIPGCPTERIAGICILVLCLLHGSNHIDF